MAGASDHKGGSGSKGPGKLVEKFPKSNFISGSALGVGAFGSVVQGKLKGKDVVVKILHSPIGLKRYNILDEIFRLEHRNLVKLIGLIDTDANECPQLIFQMADEGNLLDFVKQKRHLDPKMKPGTLLKLAKDVVEGFEYLHRLDFVHGSLAARNVLLYRFQQYLNAKISDYGMIRVIDGMGANYFKILNKPIPIRWMPREAISEVGRVSEVTKASDVWSFGVVLWEMATLGEVPFGLTMSNTEVQHHILKGSSPLALKRPVDCPPQVLNLMDNIFRMDQKDRPTFSDLKIIFTEIYERSQATQNAAPSSRPEEKKDRPFHREAVQNRPEPSKPRRGRNSHPYYSERPASGPKGFKGDNESRQGSSGRVDEKRSGSPCKEKSGPDRNVKKYEEVRGRSVKSPTKNEGGRHHTEHRGGYRGNGYRGNYDNRNRSKSKTSLYRDFDKEAAHDEKRRHFDTTPANEEKRRIDHSATPDQSRSNTGFGKSSGPSKTPIGNAPAPSRMDKPEHLNYRDTPGFIDTPYSRLPSAPPAYSEAIASHDNWPPSGGKYPTMAAENQPSNTGGMQDKQKEQSLLIQQLQQKVAKLEMDNTVNKTVQQRLQEKELISAITRVAVIKESTSREDNEQKNNAPIKPSRYVQNKASYSKPRQNEQDQCVVS